eukprot:GILK01016025.1.p1 GENE.GILK01016025.1~~GILK01016025.1.p1  ORF type:complete len:258 (+),score=27.43 GILK01016025.1:46-774(+)
MELCFPKLHLPKRPTPVDFDKQATGKLIPYNLTGAESYPPHITFLVVGLDDSQTQTFVSSILKVNSACEVRITTQLPLSENEGRPRIDYVVFLVHMQSKLSLQNCASSLSHLDLNLFLGRSAVVATQGAGPASYAFPLSDLEHLVDLYDAPLFFAELSSETRADDIARKMIKAAETSLRLVPGVSPMIIRTLDAEMYTQTSGHEYTKHVANPSTATPAKITFPATKRVATSQRKRKMARDSL